MHTESRAQSVVTILILALGGCCAAGTGVGLRQELLTSRGSQIGMGGTITMPAFTDPDRVLWLQDGTTEARIIEVVGLPDRELATRVGELWVWEMQVYESHVVLAINVVDGAQRGAAALEWRTIPGWMLHHTRLRPDIDVSEVVDCLGTPDRWEVLAGEAFMIWEHAAQLRHQGTWAYSADVQMHTLRLRIVDDRLQAVAPIESRSFDEWPHSAAERVGGGREARWTER